MMGKSKPAQTLFFQGKYKELTDLFDGSAVANVPIADTVYLVGALVFTGRDEEAHAHAARQKKSFSDDDLAAIEFFLTISEVRAGREPNIKGVGRKPNIGGAKRESNIGSASPRATFFRHQSVAFFEYYLGTRSRCEREIHSALEAAVEARFHWGRILAVDMLAHIQFDRGHVQEAIKNFERCLDLAERIENKNTAEAVRISLALSRARVSLPHEQGLEALRELYASTPIENNYSRANILLELARQATLLGRWQKTEDFLNQALVHIYQFSNIKQEVILNLRWAQLEYCRGEFLKALHFVSLAKARSEKIREEPLLFFMRGLENKILKASGLTFSAQPPRASGDESHSVWNTRIEARENISPSPFRRGEDPMGDFLDNLCGSSHQVDQILDSGLFGLLRSLRLLPGDSSSITVTVRENSGREIIFSDFRQIEKFSFRGKPKLFDFALALLTGSTTKAELFKKTWGVRYVPHLHDSIIYTNAANLRKFLGDFAYVIETSEHGYRLHPSLRIVLSSKPAPMTPEVTSFFAEERWDLSRQVGESLNERQRELLQKLSGSDLIDTRTYVRLLGVSTATANRDLRDLARRGHLVRSGRSRDIAYSLAGVTK